MAITQRGLTLEEFLELPPQKPALEYWQGEVTQKVAANPFHGRLQLSLGKLFDRFAEASKIALAFTETRFTSAGQSVVPDVILYRWERIPREPDGTMADTFETPPDIAVEVISPGQTLKDLHDRCRWYVDNGVEISLLVHPRRESVTRFRSGQPPVVLQGADRIDLDDVLPGFELTVQELFDTLKLG